MGRFRAVLVCLVVAACLGCAGEAPKQDELLKKIGQWDGVAQTAELEGPYEDWKQQECPFGRSSYYLTPWRSYMDTWPASQFLHCLGINFNLRDDKAAEPVAQLLAETGIRSARVEFGWGSLSYEDPPKIPEGTAKSWATRLKALKKAGIRPLILLNANSGWPCPIKATRVKLLKPAEKGARELFVDKTDSIVLGNTGLRGQAYQTGFPLIVKTEKDTGRCELSAPLTKALKDGPLELFTLKYRPFAGKTFADGAPNPAAQETVEGWKNYMSVICTFAKEALENGDPLNPPLGKGGKATPDAGFDIEVWNEYTFGSQFLEEKNYYVPERKFKEPIAYSNHGKTMKGHELILPLTVDYANDPANKLPGVNVISGFANQRPWDHGGDMWPGQAGYSRHYYSGINVTRIISPETPLKPNSGPLNALGQPDGTPDKKDWHTVMPGSFFVPTHIVNMPEWWHYTYQTEFMTRNIQPFPGPWGGARYSHPGTGRPADIWMTEDNFDRQPWAEKLIKDTGCVKNDPKLIALMHHMGAKASLRIFTFYSHKGLHTINLYAAQEGDCSLTFVAEAFYKALKAANFELKDDVRAQAGEQVATIARMTKLMRTGQPIETARPLAVAKLVEHKPRLVYKGDGTPAHPDRFQRDDFACLPFQLAADKFAVGYYVVTRDMIHVWKPDAEPLDPARYDMPEQTFDLTLLNVRGEGAKVSAWDPISDKEVAAEVVSGAALPDKPAVAQGRSITVRLQTVDYPRFLIITEAKPGPLVVAPRLEPKGEGAEVVFTSNADAAAKVSWGPIRQRNNKSPTPLAGSSRGDGLADQQKTVQAVAGKANRVVVQASGLPAAGTAAPQAAALGENDGVKITLESDGLTARWPFWDDDVKGVLKFAQVPAGAVTATDGALKFPPLAAGKEVEWNVEQKDRAIKTDVAGLAAELRAVKGDLQALRAALPVTAVGDAAKVEVIEWQGVPAWQADFTLSGTAHPGLAELRQRYLIAPAQGGFVVLAFKGTAEAFERNAAAVNKVGEGVKLK